MTSDAEQELPARLRAHVEYLAGELGERSPERYPNLEEARRYVERGFADADYEVRHDSFDAGGRVYRNVIAEVPGSEPGAELLLTGAHYDTVPGTPGADDNASGVAVLLELARLLRHEIPRLTLRWAAFTLEEPPWFRTIRMGSRIHARKCRESGERIAGMASLEMLGYYRDEAGSQAYPLPLMNWFYPDRGDFVVVAGNFRSRGFVRRLSRALAPSFAVESTALPFVPGVDLSDNWSFWQEGFPAAIVTDTAFFRNPNYHRSSDRPETLDYVRMGELVSGLARAFAALAGTPTDKTAAF